ncbi:MAG: helix-turn-helix transcriptional regulator [Methylotenera sp.]|nr:helix-turn-helix transcriptional regulator [Methylotenera sp.]
MDKYKHLTYSLNWLIGQEEGSQTIEADDIRSYPIPIAPDVGVGCFEIHQLGLGMLMFHGVSRFNSDSAGMMVPLSEYHVDYPEEYITIMTQRSGRSCHHEQVPKCEPSWEPGYDYFRRTSTAHGKAFLDASQTNEMISVEFSSSALIQLIGESATAQLYQSIGLAHSPCAIVRPVPLEITSVLQAATSLALVGQARKVYAQAKVLEYLGFLLAHFSTKGNNLDLKKCRDSIYDLRAYLVSLEGKLPTLQELAQLYGMSARQLNEEFNKEFGQSIYSYVTNYRLDQSHVALIQSDAPMKVIANALGYSHVNHYITAFKNKFGYSPGSLRKN